MKVRGRAGRSGIVGNILEIQSYGRDKKGMFQRDQDKTDTEFMLRVRPYTTEFQKMARDYDE